MDYSLSNALDQAVAKMPPFRQTVYQWRLSNAAYRRQVLAQMYMDLMEDEEFAAMLTPVFGTSGFSATAPMPIGGPDWIKLLDWIMANLPAILSMILKLFPK
jgi:hypothetical protein